MVPDLVSEELGEIFLVNLLVDLPGAEQVRGVVTVDADRAPPAAAPNTGAPVILSDCKMFRPSVLQ